MTGWDPELTVQCRVPIVWEAFASSPGMGEREYADPRVVLVFVGPSQAIESGVYQEGMPRRLIIVPPFDADGVPIERMTSRDRITLAAPFDDPTAPTPIKTANPVLDENGVLHHFEVYA